MLVNFVHITTKGIEIGKLVEMQHVPRVGDMVLWSGVEEDQSYVLNVVHDIRGDFNVRRPVAHIQVGRLNVPVQ